LVMPLKANELKVVVPIFRTLLLSTGFFIMEL
jgi:hypothetical protein